MNKLKEFWAKISGGIEDAVIAFFVAGAITIFVYGGWLAVKEDRFSKGCSRLVTLSSFSEETFQHKYLVKLCVANTNKDYETSKEQGLGNEYLNFVGCLGEAKVEADIDFCKNYFIKAVEIKNRQP